MEDNKQILQEIREMYTDDDYFPHDVETLEAFTTRIDGENDIAKVLYDASVKIYFYTW